MKNNYCASISHFCKLLLSCWLPDGAWVLGRASTLVVSPWSASHWGGVGWWMRTPCPVCASASAAHVMKLVSFSTPALTTPCLLWPWFSSVYLGVLYLWRHVAFRGDVSGCHILWILGIPKCWTISDTFMPASRIPTTRHLWLTVVLPMFHCHSYTL